MKAVSGMMLTLLLVGILTIASNVEQVEAQDNLVLEMGVSKTIVRIGETIDMTLTLRNNGNTTITLPFGSSQVFDACLYGHFPYRWSYDKVFAYIYWELTLHPGDAFSQTLEWNFYLYDPWSGNYIPPDPGHYQLIGLCVAGSGSIRTEKLPIWLVTPGTIIVPNDYPTIQEAINYADQGNTVLVRNGTYYEHVVVNKTVSLVGESMERTTVDGGSVENTITVTADGVLIRGFTVMNGGGVYPNSGIFLDSVEKTIITGNNISSNQAYGIFVVNSNSNSIQDNIVTRNRADGIHLEQSSNNIIERNAILNNFDGITIQYMSSSNRVAQNNITGNIDGISIAYASNNTVFSNNIVFTGEHMGMTPNGIYLHGSSDNSISGNSVENYYYGFRFYESSNNSIYHNNLLSNTYQIDDYSWHNPGNVYPSINKWDSDCEGNYWSDYTGTDSSSPPDGIGDTPYVIDANNQDNFPFMNRYWPSDVNRDLRVDIKDLACTATAFGSCPGHPRWNPSVDLNIDNRIDIKDLALIAKNYGKTYP